MEVRNKNKLRRKLQKYKNILFSDYGLEPLNGSSKCLMVCNAGLVNGIQREDILQFFKQYGPIENIVTFPQKSYSFITYQCAFDAESCYDTVNGNLKLCGMNGPLYLLFVKQAPDVEVLSNFTSKLPPGLVLIEEFVSKEEENILLGCVNMEEDSEGKVIKHRRVKHYGYEFQYSTNSVNKNNPLPQKLPSECDFLWDRLKEKGHKDLLKWKPNQLTVNHYLPGQGIPPHIDTHSSFHDPILSLSLGSDVIMEFRNSEKIHVSLLLPRRSLLIMSGESRYAWTHGITPKRTDIVMIKDQGLTVRERGTRTSFTFRIVQQGECKCNYPTFCDSQTNVDLTVPEKAASHIENNYVHKVYENISQHFSHTRHTPWPNVLKFVNSFPKGSILIDVGCGNGKYFGFNKGIYEIGCDVSSNLAITCKNRGFEINVSNCLHLPFKSEIADGIISIAVIHHLATRNRRLQAIKAMVRVLRYGGKALIYVWAKNQTKDNKKSNYLKSDKELKGQTSKDEDNQIECVINDKQPEVTTSEVKLTATEMLKLPVHTNKTVFKFQDILVPWKLNTKQNQDTETSSIFLRYYHVFEENELELLCKEIPEVKVVSSYYDQGNWCVIIQKV